MDCGRRVLRRDGCSPRENSGNRSRPYPSGTRPEYSVNPPSEVDAEGFEGFLKDLDSFVASATEPDLDAGDPGKDGGE